MSDFFKGVTFPWQEVTPSDDAIVRQTVLPDRRLSGCGLSYSGYTLTMAAGTMIVCGRQFRHTAAQNWAITDAASGYARLLLSIDVTKASTEDAFEQINTRIEYATAVDGFPKLRQDDINGTGTIYQAMLCVVSLGPGGITGIVDQIIPSDNVFYPGRPVLMGGYKITGLGAPTADTDASTKEYVDDRTLVATDPNNDGNIVLRYGSSVVGGGGGGGSSSGGLTAEEVQAMIDASLGVIENGTY